MSNTLCRVVPVAWLASTLAVAVAQPSQPASAASRIAAPVKGAPPARAASDTAPLRAAAPGAPPAVPAALAGSSTYRSAFEGYRPMAEQPVVPWREANDEVGRIGGWQSYAREAQASAAPPAASAPKPSGDAGRKAP